jgi:hypothetical protein
MDPATQPGRCEDRLRPVRYGSPEVQAVAVHTPSQRPAAMPTATLTREELQAGRVLAGPRISAPPTHVCSRADRNIRCRSKRRHPQDIAPETEAGEYFLYLSHAPVTNRSPSGDEAPPYNPGDRLRTYSCDCVE